MLGGDVKVGGWGVQGCGLQEEWWAGQRGPRVGGLVKDERFGGWLGQTASVSHGTAPTLSDRPPGHGGRFFACPALRSAAACLGPGGRQMHPD